MSSQHSLSDGLAPKINAALVLADGAVFFGQGIGMVGTTSGEICFTTGLTGYQETLTDASFAGQIINFTFPHIGNVGANDEDEESLQPYARGLVVREPVSAPSNFRSGHTFNDWLAKHHLIGISGVDTRAITRHIRLKGAQNAVICHVQQESDLDIAALKAHAKALPSMEGLELAKIVTRPEQTTWTVTSWELGKGFGSMQKPEFNVVAIDYGAKHNIFRNLASYGCHVTVVPADTTAEAILALNPDGVFLSNGPGDPAATGQYALDVLRTILKTDLPVFGICLGHQLLSLALGARTAKMGQGHRGANHPVKNLEKGTVEITSQNHGFVVVKESLPNGVVPSHISLFDGTIEGIRVEGKPVFSVQYHPEASPGPHDSLYLFERFITYMREHAGYAEKKKLKV